MAISLGCAGASITWAKYMEGTWSVAVKVVDEVVPKVFFNLLCIALCVALDWTSVGRYVSEVK